MIREGCPAWPKAALGSPRKAELKPPKTAHGKSESLRVVAEADQCPTTTPPRSSRFDSSVRSRQRSGAHLTVSRSRYLRSTASERTVAPCPMFDHPEMPRGSILFLLVLPAVEWIRHGRPEPRCSDESFRGTRWAVIGLSWSS